ncbi:4Fe-4S dicluster domain-containing protein [candidate division FCPU426 bacterium]|nr:4Fe-4S dicluster domain-containing protein [candidate division FCPU426 bacterium]
MKLEDKLFLVTFVPDSETHLSAIKQETCRTCAGKPCISGCPAACWEHEAEKNEVLVSFEGCLECGTCRIICPYHNIQWKYPRGGFGVKYKFG